MRTSLQNQMAEKKCEWVISPEPVPYEQALLWMQSRVQDLQKVEGNECIWLLEHPPLYTKGSSGKDKDILEAASLPVFETGRGGQVTYHGPGQRIAYVMLDLKPRYQDIRKYVFELEDWIINTLKAFGVQGERRSGRVGIWVEHKGNERKIAAIGVRVQKWITSHGIAINVNPDLSAYNNIVPCGLNQYGVTSLADLGSQVSLEEVDQVLQKTCPFELCA